MNLRISRRAALSLALASFFPWAAPLAQAQGTAARWPQQAVRFVVPFPAGSAPDVLIRHVGAKLGEMGTDELVTVYENGALVQDYSLEEIRARADEWTVPVIAAAAAASK